ncbi:MAG: DnaJ domain-containing protein [Pseudomonadales bacterium]|nr:DnaJ domain-containing protein [Pseudomonadales bacterium]
MSAIRQLQSQILFKLRHQPNKALSEYELLRQLQSSGHIPENDSYVTHSTSLFRIHFILFHCLYDLRDRLWAKQLAHLDISPLRLSLMPYCSQAEGMVAPDPLHEYYLDFSHLSSAHEREINQKISEFWSKIAGHECGFPNKSGFTDAKQKALIILELKEPVTYQAIKTQYRRLAMRYHPDRGGSNEKLKDINTAMDTLTATFKI